MVYGASNQCGRAFAKFLSERGYALILIDRKMGDLDAAEAFLRENTKATLSLHKIPFLQEQLVDQTKIQSVLADINAHGGFVKFFVNCKNLRLARKHLTPFDSVGLGQIVKISRENAEGFAGLLSLFVREMGKVTNACVINVRNIGEEEEKDLIGSDLMFYATSRFTTDFTAAL